MFLEYLGYTFFVTTVVLLLVVAIRRAALCSVVPNFNIMPYTLRIVLTMTLSDVCMLHQHEIII